MNIIFTVPPTPNADLHLGHLSGPYLAADTFNRCKKATGEESILLSGLDSMEEWVSNINLSELKRKHSNIKKDFKYLSIDFDAFLLPQEDMLLYETVHLDTYKNLLTECKIKNRKEKILSNGKEYGFNSKVTGKCKSCYMKITGYSCPHCYAVSEPYELIEEFVDFKDADYIEVDNDFLEVTLRSTESNHCELTKKFISQNIEKDFDIRLTYQSDYGVRSFKDRGKVLRNHLFYYFMFLKKKLNYKNIQSLSVFMGMDNLVAGGFAFEYMCNRLYRENLVSISSNNMLFYEGEKFSKSKSHGPTVKQFRKHYNSVNTNSSLRVYLGALNLTKSNCNFRHDEFNDFDKKYTSYLATLESISPVFCYSDCSRKTINEINNFLSRKNDKSYLYRYYIQLLTTHYIEKQILHNDIALLMSILDPESYKQL